jgi:uncharacterized Zn-finger protein
MVHMNERQFKCDWNQCYEEFLRYDLLETHINKVHQNLRPFQCHKCDKSYKSQKILNNHLKNVHENNVN